jgi:membrane dipeptidase
MGPPHLPVATKRSLQLLDTFYTELEAHHDKMRLATKADDIAAAKSDEKVAAVLSLEGVEPLAGDLGLLRMFYRLGVRAAGLTWNWRNEAADGLYEERSGGGLTTFGVALIEEMNRLGMIVDVAHLASAGVRDVLEISQAPIIVSHADAKAVCGHFRNLTDEQLEAVAGKGGVVCAGFDPSFLEPDARVSSLDKLLDQMDYMVRVAGKDHIGLGSDFDGVELPADSRIIDASGRIILPDFIDLHVHLAITPN